MHTRLVVDSDEALLRRILQNLLSNAVRYTRRGRIVLGCRRVGDQVRVEVHDQGPGIPERLAVGSPARFSHTTDVGIRRLTPELGQDEDYVFGELLQLSSAQRRDLEAREVIC